MRSLGSVRYLQLRRMIWVGDWKLSGISCFLDNGIYIGFLILSHTILEGFGSNLVWNYPSLGPELVAIVISAKPMPRGG